MSIHLASSLAMLRREKAHARACECTDQRTRGEGSLTSSMQVVQQADGHPACTARNGEATCRRLRLAPAARAIPQMRTPHKMRLKSRRDAAFRVDVGTLRSRFSESTWAPFGRDSPAKKPGAAYGMVATYRECDQRKTTQSDILAHIALQSAARPSSVCSTYDC